MTRVGEIGRKRTGKERLQETLRCPYQEGWIQFITLASAKKAFKERPKGLHGGTGGGKGGIRTNYGKVS